jgi:diguanylate cyclase (GGDEF)-like protein
MPAHDDASRALVERALWEHARDVVLDLATDGTVRFANPAASVLVPEGTGSLLDVLHPVDAERMAGALAADGPVRLVFRAVCRVPQRVWRTFEVTVAEPVDGGWLVAARDVTGAHRAVAVLDAHRSALDLLARGEPAAAAFDALARSIEEASGDGRAAVLVARGADLELAAAPNLRADAAAAFERLPGAAHPDVFPVPGALSGALAAAADAHGLGFGWAAPVLDDAAPGGVLLLFPGAKRFPNAAEQDALDAALPLARVILASSAMRDVVRRASRDDVLTGVLGRAAFFEALDQIVRRSRDVLAVLVVRVDGIAELNDAHGYGAGDAVLAAVAERLAGSVRGRDVVGRISGTRFAIGCTAAGEAAAFPQFALRVRNVLAEPVTVGDAVLEVRTRIASASRRGKVADPRAVVLDAERALASGTPEVQPERRRADRPTPGRSGSARNDR